MTTPYDDGSNSNSSIKNQAETTAAVADGEGGDGSGSCGLLGDPEEEDYRTTTTTTTTTTTVNSSVSGASSTTAAPSFGSNTAAPEKEKNPFSAEDSSNEADVPSIPHKSSSWDLDKQLRLEQLQLQLQQAKKKGSELELEKKKMDGKRQKVLHLFDNDELLHLDLPTIGKILEYLDVASLVRVGSCNSLWQKQVYDDDGNNPNLWKEIGFMDHHGGYNNYKVLYGDTFEQTIIDSPASKITDRQLATLLQRCKARERCEVLYLTGCLQLEGHGLEPLRGSFTLREIDLRLVGSRRGSLGGQEINADAVLPILDSMAPINTDLVDLPAGNLGLTRVQFDRNIVYGNYYDKYDPQIREWLENHCDSLVEAAKKNRPLCDFCNEVIVGKMKEDDLLWKIKVSYCDIYKQMTCGAGSSDCPLTRECEHCAIRCIQEHPDCNHWVYDCDGCDRGVCKACRGDDLHNGGYCDQEGCSFWYCHRDGCANNRLKSCKNFCVNEHGECARFCSSCKSQHEETCTRVKQEKAAAAAAAAATSARQQEQAAGVMASSEDSSAASSRSVKRAAHVKVLRRSGKYKLVLLEETGEPAKGLAIQSKDQPIPEDLEFFDEDAVKLDGATYSDVTKGCSFKYKGNLYPVEEDPPFEEGI